MYKIFDYIFPSSEIPLFCLQSNL